MNVSSRPYSRSIRWTSSISSIGFVFRCSNLVDILQRERMSVLFSLRRLIYAKTIEIMWKINKTSKNEWKQPERLLTMQTKAIDGSVQWIDDCSSIVCDGICRHLHRERGHCTCVLTLQMKLEIVFLFIHTFFSTVIEKAWKRKIHSVIYSSSACKFFSFTRKL